MIQANELRIGNYIYDDFNEVHIVEKIESEKYNEWNGSDPSLVVFSKIDDKYNGMYTCDIVSGIPLTEEWLLNMGFQYDYVFYTKGLLNLCPNRNGNYTPYIHTLTHGRVELDVKFVHQIQNLYFELTGSELVLSTVPYAI